MEKVKMGRAESRFARIIWQEEPISTTRLVKLAESRLGWKRTTSYTVLRRLCERGIFRSESGTVTSLFSEEEFYALQSQHFVEETFGGSLPAFLNAFSSSKPLSEREIDEIQAMIDAARKE